MPSSLRPLHVALPTGLALALVSLPLSTPLSAQPRPRRGDADTLRPTRGQPIAPTTNLFDPTPRQPDDRLRSIFIGVEGEGEPTNVLPGSSTAPTGLIGDPLRPITIFRGSGTTETRP
ncbi:MAG: hypothetical protein HC919_13950 [Oscillatoriales cyanobacterium SM2_2_1]|nr:hypothetical protein [Oscillatoriales cyanobacterium SM2_2_1]